MPHFSKFCICWCLKDAVLHCLCARFGNAVCADSIDIASRAAVVIADLADAGDFQRRAIAIDRS